MPWKEATAVALRQEFVHLALEEGANISALCRRFGISRQTGYKWLRRYREGNEALSALVDRSRRPHHSPCMTSLEMERLVLDVRQAHPAWGGRKIRAYLQQQGHDHPPAASTITTILQRNGRIDPEEAVKHHAYQSFEMTYPNELWQMDFKGHFLLQDGSQCHPLVVLDDHSRYLLGLRACANERLATVQPFLVELFRRYGLPKRILMDNGPPWGISATGRWTRFEVWLLLLGINVCHGAPHHPQTQGKAERLHRTLQAETLCGQAFADHQTCQRAFDAWQMVYNTERPHEALSMATPRSRYHVSPRPFPETLPPIVYDRGEVVRRVDQHGKVMWRGREYRVGKALARCTVAVRPAQENGVLDIYLGSNLVAQISTPRDNQGGSQV